MLNRLYNRFRFIRPLFILAHQRIDWSPFLILGELWELLTNLGAHREIAALLKLPPFAEIAQDNPGLAFKYVIPNYLARGFTVAERASCFLHHYRRIHAALPESVLRQILQGDVTFYEVSIGNNCFALTVGLPRPPLDKEGELSFSLLVDGKRIVGLSFIIVPGWVVKSEAVEVLLITRLQGTAGCRPEMKLVRKRLHEFPPSKLLLVALQGLSDTFKIGEMEAVSAENQRSYGLTRAYCLKRRYDDFFSNIGMSTTAAGFYRCSIPIAEKPLASVESNARSRARKRRTIRQQIQSACTAFLLGEVDPAGEHIPLVANRTRSAEEVRSSLDSISCPESNSSLDLWTDDSSASSDQKALTCPRNTR